MNNLEYFLQIIYALKITVFLALGALILGLVLGLLGALMERGMLLFRIIAQIWHLIIRALPEIIVIFIFYFGLSIVLSALLHTYVEVSAFLSGVIALGIIFGAYASQIIQSAMNSIDQGEIDAALSLGMSKYQAFIMIALPNIAKHAFPGLMNLWLVVLKDSSIVSVIGVVDIMRASQTAAAQNFAPLTFYLFAAFLYLLLTTLSYIGARFLNKKLHHGEQYERISL
ncbi:ABC transporter permease subunit [Fangia hongkongensis]|uniref:ABC transporter permease subunit n=1 Tax=Fangia hongkongensis TaxID=270495 RepID=UPI00036F0470|nr:ABC transporter permease subunit [Fangia hongkongensis]MBK2124890.1 ABC transporter permease subunit [Fangia hongkongensis]